MKFTSDINSRAKEIREEAAARFGGKAQDYNWQEAVKLACVGFEFEPKKAMLAQTFIAKTKTGIEIEVIAQNTEKRLVTNHKIACLPTQSGKVYAVELTQPELKQLVGIDIPKAFVALVQQEAWKTFVDACGHERYMARQAKPKTLEDQREELRSAEYNLYSPENFPGSKAWHAWNKALKALQAFDEAHPEVKAGMNKKTDGYIPTEDNMDL